MATRTSAQSGLWRDTSTWGAAAPGDGDDFVITSGHTVTIDVGFPVTVGNSAATGTFAGIVRGTLVIEDVLTLRGGLDQEKSGVVTGDRLNKNGSITFDPASTTTYHWRTPNTGSGTPSITLTGERNIFDPTRNRTFLITTSLVRGGNRAYMDFTLSSVSPNLTWTDVDITEFGGTGNTVATRGMSYVGSAACSIQWTRVRWLSNFGKLSINMNSLSDFTLDVQYTDFRSPRNVDAIEVFADTAKVSGVRQFYRCTAHRSTTFNLLARFRDFTIDGGVYSNVRWIGDTVTNNVTYQNIVFLVDQPVNGTISGLSDSALIIQDCIFFTNGDNPHLFAANGPQGFAANIFRRNLIDGNAFVGSDDGDAVLTDAPITIEQNLSINRGGSLFSVTLAGMQVTARRNTFYGVSVFANAGESIMEATTLTRLSSNLFVSQATGILYDVTLVTQSGFNCDYNGFFDQTNAANLDHPTLAQNGYLEGPSSWWTTGNYGDDNKGQHDIYGDPQFADATRTMLTWYNLLKGSGGSFANLQTEMVRLNGTSLTGTDSKYDGRFGGEDALRYIRQGFAPKNKIYWGTGDPDDGSPTIGAVDARFFMGTH